jgi:hypothetical protein
MYQHYHYMLGLELLTDYPENMLITSWRYVDSYYNDGIG